MAKGYLFLRHHAKDKEAENLLSDKQFQWQPDLIQRNLVRNAVREPNIKMVLKEVEIMQGIVLHQIEKNSAFAKAFRNELDILGNPAPGRVKFRVYSGSQEMILSSGAQFKHWIDPPRGFHYYADILQEAHEALIEPGTLDTGIFPAYLTNFKYFLPAEKRSVFLVTDSQGKFFNSITGGKIIAIGGGNFGHIHQVLMREQLEWRTYRWIIVYCGTNCRANNRYQGTQREFQWRNLRDILVREANRRNDGSIIYCTNFSHPHVDVSPGLADKVEQELEGTGVKCINWRHFENPYLDTDGSPIQKYFDNFDKRQVWKKDAEIHLNHAGLNILWKTRARFIPELKFLPMTFSGTALSMPKFLFQDEDTNQPMLPPEDRVQPGASRISAGALVSSRKGPTFTIRNDGCGVSDSHISVGDDHPPSTSTIASDQNPNGSNRLASQVNTVPDLRITCDRERSTSACRVFYPPAKKSRKY